MEGVAVVFGIGKERKVGRKVRGGDVAQGHPFNRLFNHHRMWSVSALDTPPY
jgi:hypothetical protein